MKKALIMLLLIVAVFGAFGAAQADPTTPGCEAQIDVLCRWDHDTPEDTSDDLDCVVFVDLRAEAGDPTLILCQEAPEPPAAVIY